MKRITPRRFGLIACLALSMLLNGTSAKADEDCNCSTEGQCAAAMCCFVHDDCMATNRKCKVTGTQGSYTCSAADSCSYSGPPCGTV